MENKGKYKEIESDCSNKSPKRSEKCQKIRESKDPSRTVALMTKKKNANKFKNPKADIPIVNRKKLVGRREDKLKIWLVQLVFRRAKVW